jgi:hypothetical protein
LKEAGRPKETGEIIQAQEAIYALDMGGFWPGDNCRIIAAILNKKAVMQIGWKQPGLFKNSKQMA